MNIIYSSKSIDKSGYKLSTKAIKETFKEAIDIQNNLVSGSKKIAYFFIDPLINSFEAANQFYFNLFDCESIDKINTYKSGASPIQAISDAKELIDCGLYDAVFVFGYEPLLTNKKIYGKEEILKAMNIFEDYSLIQCYNKIAHCLCRELDLSEKQIIDLFDKLFMNYYRTYKSKSNTLVSKDRGRYLDKDQGDLFKLTDCANPNIDFSGGIILTKDNTADYLHIPEKNRIKVKSSVYSMVQGSPDKIEKILGKKDNIFPHLKRSFLKAQSQSNIKIVEEFKKENLYLEVYTCYPPVPIAFLLTTGMVDSIKQLPSFLEGYEITITGGMNFARAPWNNPALNAVIDMYHKLKEGPATYGLVHGNGGIGEVQGVTVFESS